MIRVYAGAQAIAVSGRMYLMSLRLLYAVKRSNNV
jgi:hypothetical protein